MVNHPNRGRRPGLAASSEPADINAARSAAGLTLMEAADLIHTTCRALQQGEAGDRRMHPAVFELFTIKTQT